MKLLAAGRASEIYDLGDGRVLRRFKAGGDPEREALAMRHAARHGYPVPRVLEVAADQMVLQRIDGPTLLAAVRRRPWTLRAAVRTLAGLHRRLHEIEAPSELPGIGAGDRLLHLDLHPQNVLLGPEEPVVIDWANARRGDPAVDVALARVIMATSGGALGRVALRWFPQVEDGALAAACDFRLADPNVTERERRAVRALYPASSRPRP
jgi:hypothetical protein